MLQLEKMLEFIAKDYVAEYDRECYFATVSKDVLIEYAMMGEKKGRVRLEVE